MSGKGFAGFLLGVGLLAGVAAGTVFVVYKYIEAVYPL